MSVIHDFSFLPSMEMKGWDADSELEARPSQLYYHNNFSCLPFYDPMVGNGQL